MVLDKDTSGGGSRTPSCATGCESKYFWEVKALLDAEEKITGQVRAAGFHTGIYHIVVTNIA